MSNNKPYFVNFISIRRCEYSLYDFRKVELFLCSRDIKVGDKFRRQYYNSFEYTPEMVCIGVDGDTIYSEGRNDDIYHNKESCIKVLGKISLDAYSFLKNGQELAEDEVEIIDWGDNDAPDIEVRVKGPCGHFH